MRSPSTGLGGGDWKELHQGKTLALQSLDEIKFLEDSFHYQVRFSEGGDGKTPPSPQSDVVIAPQPTGLLGQGKKRRLPDWMAGAESPAKKTKTPTKATSSDEKYEKNVRCVVSSPGSPGPSGVSPSILSKPKVGFFDSFVIQTANILFYL